MLPDDDVSQIKRAIKRATLRNGERPLWWPSAVISLLKSESRTGLDSRADVIGRPRTNQEWITLAIHSSWTAGPARVDDQMYDRPLTLLMLT